MSDRINILLERVAKIEVLEKELLQRASGLMQPDIGIYPADFFVIGAVKRAISLSSGFRQMMLARNFTCAAAMLRMQIDTAARIYALRLVPDLNEFGMQMIGGERFDRQKSKNGERLKDIFIIAELAKDYPWIKPVYEQTSDFVHLSGRHLFTSIAKMNDADRTVHFQVGPEDPERDEGDYCEILDAFFEATKLTGLTVAGYLEAKRKGLYRAGSGEHP